MSQLVVSAKGFAPGAQKVALEEYSALQDTTTTTTTTTTTYNSNTNIDTNTNTYTATTTTTTAAAATTTTTTTTNNDNNHAGEAERRAGEGGSVRGHLTLVYMCSLVKVLS